MPLPAKTYPVKELAGCQVMTVEGECLGLLVDVLPSGGNDIFVVQQGLREMMVPALVSVIKTIDLEKKRIEVELPSGLREIYEDA
jgi:16S rRNA processing protein RimM